MPETGSIRTLAGKVAEEAVMLRKALHRLPEPAGMEFRTADLLRQTLAPLPVTILPPFLKTDVVAVLSGRRPGKCVLLRADIDALPMPEGMRHACGHDGHAAILWGTLKVLSILKDSWDGTVVGVFQPGEEIKAMAADLVQAGLLERYRPDFVYGLHGWPGIPEKEVRTRVGTIMAAAGFFRFLLRGRGGHGSRPEQAHNPLVAAARLVGILSDRDARSCREKTVVSVCRFQGGTNENIIPDDAIVEGTTRYLNEPDGLLVHRFLDEAAERIRGEEAIRVTLDYRTPYPPTINDRFALERLRTAVRRIAPELRWTEANEPSMAADDFAFYLRDVPGAYLHLGLGEDWPALHGGAFEFNDNVIETGISLLAGAVSRPSENDA